jgi:hypothetical protein
LVLLPECPNKKFVEKNTTRVKWIIFPNEEPIVAFDGKPLGEKSSPWTGYGTYQH